MASSMSAALPPPLSPKPSNSDFNQDDEEYEYEEIEVEEEVEEEIEEEVSDDDSDVGEDLTPVREEIQGNGIFQVMEPKEEDEPVKSSSMTVVGISISKIPLDIPRVHGSVGDSRISVSSNKDLTHVKDEGTTKTDKPDVSYEESGVNDMKRKRSEGNGDVAPAMNDVQPIVVETNPTALEFEEDMLISPVATVEDRQISPRLHAPLSWLRGSSSVAEVHGENKRQRILCEFYAKGWCIKGKACKFLHTRDGLHAAVQTSEIKNEASSSAFISPHHVVENSTSNADADKLVFCKENGLSSSLLPPGKESCVQNSYSDNFRSYTAPPVKDNLSEGNITYPGRFDLLPDYLNHGSRYSTFETSADVVNRKGDLVQNHCTSISHHQPRQPISYSLSPWKTDAFGTNNHLKRITSPFSYSGSENLLRNRYSKYGTKVSSYDWEPSIPFRPSHDITRKLLLKESLYDPIRDSVEQKEIKPVHMKSSSGEGSSMHNVHNKSYVSEENRGLNALQVEDSGKQNVGSSSYDNRLSYEKLGNETNMTADEPRKNDESGIDSKKDEHLEKPHNSFQTELIDYIKELLKPTWREGLMSKDAYKLIVKKSSDKVLSSMQPDQIPYTSDSIKLYLYSSESKLAKLVEAYIEKYGKC